jgi:alpha-1,2-mannosyltransferase
MPTATAARRLAVPATVGLVVGLGAVAWLVHFHLSTPPPNRLVDLVVYRDAGRSVLDGRAIYDHLSSDGLPFTYPPLAALLMVPLAWLPFMTAGWLWTASELVLTAVVTWWAFRSVLDRSGRWWPVALGVLSAAMVWMLPLRDEVKFGQVDVLLVALCLADCVVARPRWPRGLLVGIASAVKLTPLVFVPYLWFTGRRRAAAVAGGVFVGLSVLPAAVIPHDWADYWTKRIFDSERLRPNAGTSNQALRGMLLRLELPGTATTVLWLAACLAVAYVGYRRAVAAARDGDETAGVALTGLLAVLLSPVAWIHHLAWLPLVIGVLAADGRRRSRVVWAALVWAFFVVKTPWYAHTMLRDGLGPVWLGRLLEDSYGLAAIALVCALPWRSVHNRLPRVMDGDPSLRHHAQEGEARASNCGSRAAGAADGG